MKKSVSEFHKRIVMGLELEGYTILVPPHIISRKLAFHKKGAGEKGERFGRDWSIGTEYNSRPFRTIREGFFLLKSGLRKYNTTLYRTTSRSKTHRQIFLVGGWKDRFAGAHIHVSLADHVLTFEQAKKLAAHVHDHLPLVIAMGANSPVWGDKITHLATNRVIKGSRKYFHPITYRGLTRRRYDEMTYSRGRKTKPPTLEIRVLDSNIPEFAIAAACIIKASLLAALRRKKKSNSLSYFRYLRSRQEAAVKGMGARLCWNGEWMSAPEYLDRFIWVHREELKEMDIPYEILDVLKLLKKEMNGSRILKDASEKAYETHPQTWQRRFAKRYTKAIDQLLGSSSLKEFIRTLGVKAPNISRVWLGRNRLKLL